jgi:hypothetical protein
MSEFANAWRFNEEQGTEVCQRLAFTAERAAAYRGREYQVGDEVVIDLPRPIDRATLDDMAGEGGPWGWGGYTNDQLEVLEAGTWEESSEETPPL